MLSYQLIEGEEILSAQSHLRQGLLHKIAVKRFLDIYVHLYTVWSHPIVRQRVIRILSSL